MNTVDYNTNVADKKRRAFATFPAEHKLPPTNGEAFPDKETAILRLKNWSCVQGFAAVLGHGEHKKRQIQWILCSRHGKKTRNTHKLTEETRVRPHTLVNHNECPYKVKIRYYKRLAQWSLNVIDDSHNHDMLEDPFQLPEHFGRDPDKETAKEEARDLLASSLPYSRARRVMRTKGLRLTAKEYYNLHTRGPKRTAQQELQYALYTLEMKGFKVRVKEKYVVTQDVRQSQEVEFFFFASPKQICIARQFASHFVVITDATFNTNENALPLSVIICVTNTLMSVPIAYCFIESESTAAFLFMNECMKDLFFYDNCRGPAVLLGDFAAGLTAAMMRKRVNVLSMSEDLRGTVAQAGMDMAWELSSQMDELGSDCILQLCCWHAAEAIKKRLTREGYPLEKRKELADMVWGWIKSDTIDAVERNRGILLDNLHQKDQNYLINFYQRQESQFVTAHTKLLPNLGCHTTQRGESSHPVIKEPTNRHTPVGQAVEKIAVEVEERIHTYQQELERQKRNTPRSIDASRPFFKGLLGQITHQAIELLHKELIAAKGWVVDVEDEASQAPDGDSCQKACHLPKRYGLPCQCWLYRCVVEEIAIPLSLLHPRWLMKAPEIVVGWQMTFDPATTPADYARLTGTEDAPSQSSSDSDSDDDQGPAPEPVRSRYDRRGLDLLEAGASSAYEIHSKIAEGHRAEEYTREVTKAIQKVNRVFNEKYEKTPLPQSFTVAKKNDDALKYKKNGSRRRALTGREAADEEDRELRRKTRAEDIDKARKEKHTEQIRKDRERQSPSVFTRQTPSAFSQQIWPDESREPSSSTHKSNLPEDGVSELHSPFVPNDDSDSDIEFLGTQPVQNPSQVPSEGQMNTPSPLLPDPALENFSNIDDFDDFPPLSPAPLKSAPPLIEWPARLSQQRRLVLPEEYDHAPSASATTRAKRGVASSKSYKQQRMESQEGHDAKKKVDRQAEREAAAARKRAKAMKPRTEDVSQLEDALAKLGSSPPLPD